MLGYYAQYSREYLWVLMTLTTLFFALPLFLVPLKWAKLMQWDLPVQEHLAVYFGRCLGAFILVIELAMLRTLIGEVDANYAFDLLFAVFIVMFLVHVYGALRRIQPITETLEIGFWMILFALNMLFYPAQQFVF